MMPNPVPAAAEGMPHSADRLTYLDLEAQINDVDNMSEIAFRLSEHGQKVSGGFFFSEGDCTSLTFAIIHTNDLIQTLKKRFDQIHASNVGRAAS